MTMPEYHYISLLRLQLRHEYYSPGTCEDLQVKVPVETQRKISGLGLLFRSSGDGFRLIAEAIDQGGTLAMTRPPDEEVKLTFFLAVRNPRFLAITDADPVSLPDQLFHFSSKESSTTTTGEELLNGPLVNPVRFCSGSLSLAKTDVNATALRVTAPLGKVDTYNYQSSTNDIRLDFNSDKTGIYLLQEIDASGNPLGASTQLYFHPEAKQEQAFIAFEVYLTPPIDLNLPPLYFLDFEAREVVWRYQIFKHQQPGSLGVDDYTSLSVQHAPEGSDPSIGFLPAAGTDPILIESNGSVKLREKPYRRLRLENAGETVIENLSNPNAGQLQQDGGQWISNIPLNLYI